MKNQKKIDLEGAVYLPTWNEFQSRKGVYGSKDSSKKSDCLFAYSIGGDSSLEYEEPKNYHQKAYEYLLENQDEIKNEILNALLEKYPTLQETYDYEPDEKKEIMPDIHTVNDFKKLIGLSQLHFMNVTKDAVGYIGFEFGCEWDDEHGLGVMTHKNRVIEIGGSDTSFLQWKAEEDLTAEELEVLEKEQDLEFKNQQRNTQHPYANNKLEQQSKWWQFWK